MTDLMGALTDIVRPLPYPLQQIIGRGDIPDRILAEHVECGHVEEDDDGNRQVCDWAGVTDVAIFLSTGEELFWCPREHENAVTR